MGKKKAKVTFTEKMARIMAKLDKQEQEFFKAQIGDIEKTPTDVQFQKLNVPYTFFSDYVSAFTAGAVVHEKKYNLVQAENHLKRFTEKEATGLSDLDKREKELYEARVKEAKAELEQAKKDKKKPVIGDNEKAFKASLKGLSTYNKAELEASVIAYFGAYGVDVVGSKFLAAIVRSFGDCNNPESFTVYKGATVDKAKALQNVLFTTYYALVKRELIKPVPTPAFWEFKYRKSIKALEAEAEQEKAKEAVKKQDAINAERKKKQDAKDKEKAEALKKLDAQNAKIAKAEAKAKEKAAKEKAAEKKKKAEAEQEKAEKAAEKAEKAAESTTPLLDKMEAAEAIKKAAKAAKEAKEAEQEAAKAAEAVKDTEQEAK